VSNVSITKTEVEREISTESKTRTPEIGKGSKVRRNRKKMKKNPQRNSNKKREIICFFDQDKRK